MSRLAEPSFADRVRAVVVAIPAGCVMSYREVAAAADSPRAARAVGQVMGANRDPRVPCHRVIRADGSPGGYNRGTAAKVRRLREEGVSLRGHVRDTPRTPPSRRRPTASGRGTTHSRNR